MGSGAKVERLTLEKKRGALSVSAGLDVEGAVRGAAGLTLSMAES